MLTNKQKEKIYNLISQKQEGAYWDFKREWYSKEKIKQICCMILFVWQITWNAAMHT